MHYQHVDCALHRILKNNCLRDTQNWILHYLQLSIHLFLDPQTNRTQSLVVRRDE